jgi:hypothetical protein
MYDDQHVYSKPGGAQTPEEKKAVAKAEAVAAAGSPEGAPALVQHRHRTRDTYDHDPTTTGMYDDGHVYTDRAGSLTWKFAGGPKAEYDAATAAKNPSLVQHKHHHHKSARDTYDHDPTTTGMYDDGRVYTDKAGSLTWKFAGGPKAEYDAAVAASKPALVQHRHHHHRTN